MSELLSEAGAADAGAAEPAAAAADPAPALEPLAGGDAAGAVADPAPEAAPAAPEQPAVDPAELQAELEYTRTQLSELAQYLQSQQAQPQQQPAAPGQGLDIAGLVDEYGQITPEGLLQALAVQQQSITQAIEQRFEQFTQPFAEQREAQAYNEGLESAKDILGDNVARFGEFAADPQADEIARDRVLNQADAILTDPGFQARYGNTPRAAEIAIQQAAEQERQYLNSVRGQGAAQATNRLATLAGAATEPGAGTNGGVAGQPEFNSPGEVVKHYAALARQIDQGGPAAA